MNKKDLVVGEHYAIGDGRSYRAELQWCDIEIVKFDATFPCHSGYQSGHIFPKKGTLVKLHPHEGRDRLSVHYRAYRVANADESLYVIANARYVQRTWARHIEIITEKAKEVRAAENDLAYRQAVANKVFDELGFRDIGVGVSHRDFEIYYNASRAEFHISAETMANLLEIDTSTIEKMTV